jgi:CHASE2 domain-containing sensor protein
MTTETKVKPPAWFWIVSVLALLWNLAGAMAYIGQAYMPDEVLAAMTEAERNLYENQPAWVTGAFAIAVWGGTLGCIFLLLRKKWAKPVFIVSLIGLIGQLSYNYFLSEAFDTFEIVDMVMSVMILVIAIALIGFCNKAIAKKWIL